MADIDVYLAQILSAIYGEDVRGSIYNAINAMNNESEEAVAAARTAQDSAVESARAAASSASEAETLAETAEERIEATGTRVTQTFMAQYREALDNIIEEAEIVKDYRNEALGYALDAESAKELAGTYMGNASTSAHEAQQYRDAAQTYSSQTRTYASRAESAATDAEEVLETVETVITDTETFKGDLRNSQAIFDEVLDSEGNAILDNNNGYVGGCVRFATAEDIAQLNKNVETLSILIKRVEQILYDLLHPIEPETEE